MTFIVPFDHKQIAYVSYDPEERSLTVTYHRGEIRIHTFVDNEQFQSLVDAGNKVDVLCWLLSRK